jgi:acyl-CoA thioesterase
MIDSRLEFKVERTRTTRTFATRRVEVQQEQKGSVRKVMVLSVDFHVLEDALVDYSAPPLHQYSHYKKLLPNTEQLEKEVQDGKVPRKKADLYNFIFPLFQQAFDVRMCPESSGGQNWLGIMKKTITTQASLPLTDRTNASWVKSLHQLKTHAANVAAIGFFMDGALAFAPLCVLGLGLPPAN